jgi:hypothetical protein
VTWGVFVYDDRGALVVAVQFETQDRAFQYAADKQARGYATDLEQLGEGDDRLGTM